MPGNYPRVALSPLLFNILQNILYFMTYIFTPLQLCDTSSITTTTSFPFNIMWMPHEEDIEEVVLKSTTHCINIVF
jgi:hypothetical protein